MTLVHLGCGPIKLDGWINVDKEWRHHPDVQMDALEMMNVFYPNTVDLFFSCHMLEHLAWPDHVSACLALICCALKPGASLRLVVPDLMRVAKLYVAGDDLTGIYDGPFHEGPDTPATRFMYFCRAWEHTVLFDERLLRMLFAHAGFVNVRVMQFGQSDIAELRGIDRFESESICMEATKP